MNERVTIDRVNLEILLTFAKYGDVAKSQRRARNWFRKRPVCSAPEGRDPGCFQCQAFTAGEEALGEDDEQG